jgi:hypothetical protein
MENSVITLSDLYFYRKIITRYQNSRRSYFRFPVMIFCKNMGRVLSQKVTINAILRPNFHNLNMTYSLIERRVQEIKLMFSWFRTEKINQSSLPIILRTFQNLFNFENKEPLSIISKNFKYRNPMQIKSSVISFQANLLQNKNVMFFINKAGMYPQMNDQFQNKGLMQITVPQVQIITKNFKHGNPMHSKSYMISFQTNLLQNKNVMVINKQSGMTYHVNSGFNSSDSKDVKRESVLNVKSGDFCFHNQRNIEQEVDEIKKIVIQTKEAMIESSPNMVSPVDMNIKRHFDINRISDEVYQNIERRIRIEKERRGF